MSERTKHKMIAKSLIKDVRINIRYVKRLRKLGCSDYEISKALGISEDHPVLRKGA